MKSILSITYGRLVLCGGDCVCSPLSPLVFWSFVLFCCGPSILGRVAVFSPANDRAQLKFHAAQIAGLIAAQAVSDVSEYCE